MYNHKNLFYLNRILLLKLYSINVSELPNRLQQLGSSQRCRTINLKIQKNKLNKQQQEHLFMLFVEAKWIYNHILNDIKNRATDSYVKSLKEIEVPYQDKLIVKPYQERV